MFWQRQALRLTLLFYHSFPQKCFSSSFFSTVEKRIHDLSPFLLTAQAICCLGKRFPRIFSCLTKHLMTQVAWKVCNSICQWLLLCSTDSYSYVLITSIFCGAACHLDLFLKAKKRCLFLPFGDLLNSPSCLIKFHLIAKLTFLRGVLLCDDRKEVRNEVGRGCYWEEEDKGRKRKVTFRLAADWRICVNVRENSIYTSALISLTACVHAAK